MFVVIQRNCRNLSKGYDEEESCTTFCHAPEDSFIYRESIYYILIFCSAPWIVTSISFF